MARSVPSEAPYNLDYTALASVDVESRDCGDSKSEVRRRQSQIALASRYNGVRADQSFAWAAVSARQLDDVSEFVVNLWEPGNKQKSPLVQSTRAFASYMVQELGICETAMLASLVYMVRLSDVFAEKGLSTVNCSKQLFVACLLTATKYLYDIPQTNASWARVCQLDPSHINSMELELLEALSFHVGVSAREMDGARLYSKRRISAPTRACDNSVYVPTTTRREFPVSPMYQPSSSRRSAHRSVSSALESRSNERAEAREARFARDSVLSPNESPRAGSIRDAFSGNGHMSRDIPSPAPDETFRRSYSSGMRTAGYYPWASHHAHVQRTLSEGVSGSAGNSDVNFSLFQYSFDERCGRVESEPARASPEQYRVKTNQDSFQSAGPGCTGQVQRRLRSIGLRGDCTSESALGWGLTMSSGLNLSGPSSVTDLNRSVDSMSVRCASDCESLSSLKGPQEVEWRDSARTPMNAVNYAGSGYPHQAHEPAYYAGLPAPGDQNRNGVGARSTKHSYSETPISRIKDGHVTWGDLRGQLALADDGAMLAGDRSCDCQGCGVRRHEPESVMRRHEPESVMRKRWSQEKPVGGEMGYEQTKPAAYVSDASMRKSGRCKPPGSLYDDTLERKRDRQGPGRCLGGAVAEVRDYAMHRGKSSTPRPTEPSLRLFSEWGGLGAGDAETGLSVNTPVANGTGQGACVGGMEATTAPFTSACDYESGGYPQPSDCLNRRPDSVPSQTDTGPALARMTQGSGCSQTGGRVAPFYHPVRTPGYGDMYTPTSHTQIPSLWVPLATHPPDSGCTPSHTTTGFVPAERISSYRPTFVPAPMIPPYGVYLDEKSREYMQSLGPRAVGLGI